MNICIKMRHLKRIFLLKCKQSLSYTETSVWQYDRVRVDTYLFCCSASSFSSTFLYSNFDYCREEFRIIAYTKFAIRDVQIFENGCVIPTQNFPLKQIQHTAQI